MARPTYSKILPLAIAAVCGAIIAFAIFGSGKRPWRNGDAVCLAGPASDPLMKTLRTYACPQCAKGIDWGR